jgi:hypothetical protein
MRADASIILPRIPLGSRDPKKIDRDTKVAVATAGGTWNLKGDKYEETNEFATEDVKHARGKAYPYDFKLDGDSWSVKAGPELDILVDEVWTRVK